MARWAALLQPLSQSLLTNLAIARSECPSLLRAYLEEGSPATPPILNLAAANLLGLLIRSALCGGGAGLAFRVCARHTAHPQPVIGQCPMPAYQVSTVRGGEGHAATHPYNTAHAHIRSHTTHPCRLLSALPPEMLSPLVVPAGAADALAALARDALACSLLPAGTQDAALAVLLQLRPDVQQVNAQNDGRGDCPINEAKAVNLKSRFEASRECPPPHFFLTCRCWMPLTRRRLRCSSQRRSWGRCAGEEGGVADVCRGEGVPG